MTYKYNKINTPEELLEFMGKYIMYGFLSKNNKVYDYDDPNFNRNWYSEAILETKDDILKTKRGTCWDQVELERTWFEEHNYECMTIYIMVNLDYVNPYPTHSYLIYKDENNSWNWFENSDFENRGIHKFKSYEAIIRYQYNKYLELLKKYDVKDSEIKNIIIRKFEKPKENISPEEYMSFVINSKEIVL